MLAKMKEAKKIRDTLAAQEELSGPDNVGLSLIFSIMCFSLVILVCTRHIILNLISAANARCNCSNK
jgi:hypothetical protein